MEQITQYLLHSGIPTEQCEDLMNLIGEYGRNKWVNGWNKALEVAGHGEPHAPQIRTEPRVNQQNTGI